MESPKRIGPYRILQQIGKGGMGQVFLAEQQEPVRRRVALKVIISETPTDRILARFKAERQALAMMNHPNIAKVLDAGVTESGRPYFAMELVRGIPITEYCDKNRLILRERLRLFVQTCRAIHHAHQKGIIHRDLKPSNVLVALHDGEPIAKVIDFGLAKATHGELQLVNETLFTQFGAVVGTLEYMSPEQAGLNALDVDTRTDVYSLGVILYELLTGSTPLGRERLRREAFDRVLALIREEETPRPSSRLSMSGEELAEISKQRNTDARRLGLMLRGDLDWITVKSLEKDRTRRYDSASSLADDIERYLADEPVTARPPTLPYRVAKIYRKYRAACLAISMIFIMLLTSVVGLGAMWRTSMKSEQTARNAVVQVVIERDRARSAEDAERKAARDAELAKQQAVDALQEQSRLREEAELAKSDEVTARLEAEMAKQKAIDALQEQSRLREEAVRAKSDEAAARLKAETAGKKAIDALNEQRRLREEAVRQADNARRANAEKDTAIRNLQVAKADLETTNGRLQKTLQELSEQNQIANYSLNLREAQFRIQTGDLTIAQRILIEVPRFQRGWEWNILARTSKLDQSLAELQADDTAIEAPNRAGNGERSGDVKPNPVPQILSSHSGIVHSVAFSLDGSLLASASEDTSIKIWDTSDWSLTRTLRGHTSGVRDLAFLPSTGHLVSVGFDRTVRIWDVTSGLVKKTFQSDDVRFLSVTVSPDERTLFAAGGFPVGVNHYEYDRWRGKVICWNLDDDSVRFEIGPLEAMVRSTALDPSRKLLVTGGFNGAVASWSSLNGSPIRSYEGHSFPVYDLAFFPFEDRFCSVSGPIEFSHDLTDLSARDVGGFRLWNIETSELVSATKAGESAIYAVAVTRDGSRMILAGADQNLKIWDVRTNQHLMTLTGKGSEVKSMTISMDGQVVVTGGKDGRIGVWDGRITQRAKTFEFDLPEADAALPEAVEALPEAVEALPEADAALPDQSDDPPSLPFVKPAPDGVVPVVPVPVELGSEAERPTEEIPAPVEKPED